MGWWERHMSVERATGCERAMGWWEGYRFVREPQACKRAMGLWESHRLVREPWACERATGLWECPYPPDQVTFYQYRSWHIILFYLPIMALPYSHDISLLFFRWWPIILNHSHPFARDYEFASDYEFLYLHCIITEISSKELCLSLKEFSKIENMHSAGKVLLLCYKKLL